MSAYAIGTLLFLEKIIWFTSDRQTYYVEICRFNLVCTMNILVSDKFKFI